MFIMGMGWELAKGSSGGIWDQEMKVRGPVGADLCLGVSQGIPEQGILTLLEPSQGFCVRAGFGLLPWDKKEHPCRRNPEEFRGFSPHQGPLEVADLSQPALVITPHPGHGLLLGHPAPSPEPASCPQNCLCFAFFPPSVPPAAQGLW